MVLLFTAFLKQGGSIGKLEGLQMDLSSLLFFSIESMKRNSILVLLLKQRLHKLRFFCRKLAVRNPAGTMLDSSSLVNKQVEFNLNKSFP